MRDLLTVSAMALVASSLVMWNAGCVQCPDPEPLEERLHEIVYQTYVESGRIIHNETGAFHPAQSEIVVEVVSDREVRVSYERDGQEVVEVYSVSEHQIHEEMM